MPGVGIGIYARMYHGTIDLGKREEHVDSGFFDFDKLPDNLCEPSKRIIDNYLDHRIYREESFY